MAYCPQCGAVLAQAARYCGSCGRPAAAAPPMGPGSPMPPMPAPAAPVVKDTQGAQTLLLAGALLGVAMPLLAAIILVALGAAASWIPFAGGFAAAILTFVAVVFVLLSVGWALVVLHARRLLAQGRVHDGAVVAVIAGAVMVLMGLPFLVLPGLAGLLVLLAGVLAWSA